VDVGLNAVNYFTADGDFQRRVQVPSRGLTLVYTANGWVGGDWGLRGDGSAQPRIMMFDNDFQNRKELLTLPDAGQGAGMNIEMGPDGMVATFSPINSRPLMQPSRDGKFVYIVEPITMKVHVIDVAKREVVRSFTHDSPSVPFDEDWANARLAATKEMLPRQDRNIDFKPLYPDNFPVVREFHVNSAGNLVFNRWMGDPDDHNSPLVLDPQGKEVDGSADWDVLSRIAAAHDDSVFITTFGEDDEEGGLAKVPAGQANRFIKDNPIVFDGMAGRRIEMSDGD